jgi:hypothetical protein
MRGRKVGDISSDDMTSEMSASCAAVENCDSRSKQGHCDWPGNSLKTPTRLSPYGGVGVPRVQSGLRHLRSRGRRPSGWGNCSRRRRKCAPMEVQDLCMTPFHSSSRRSYADFTGSRNRPRAAKDFCVPSICEVAARCFIQHLSPNAQRQDLRATGTGKGLSYRRDADQSSDLSFVDCGRVRAIHCSVRHVKV